MLRHDDEENDRYLDELKSVACIRGYDGDEIETLLKEGFSMDEIEEFIYGECF